MRPHNHSISLFIEFILEHKKRFSSGYIKQITRNILRDFKGILIIVTKTINTSHSLKC